MRVMCNLKQGDVFDLSESIYPARLEVIQGISKIGGAISTDYGYVLTGYAEIETPHFTFRLEAGGFFCIPGEFSVRADGILVTIRRLGYRGVPIAGRIEDIGRLSYIDGCSDTILVMPPRLGDPVLNYLHFPQGTTQTLHTHPTYRLGVIARGAGFAYGPAWEKELSEGCVFELDPHELHGFHTVQGNLAMDIIAFHPDSDWGPTDAFHPMLNRTYVRNQR